MQKSIKTTRFIFRFSIWFRVFRKLLMFFLLLCFITITMYTFFIRIFRIKNIVVVGQNIQISVDRHKLVDNLWLIDTDKLKLQILKDNREINSVLLAKKYPDTLELTVILKKPIAILTTTTRIILLDCSGIAIGSMTSDYVNLPEINLPLNSIPDGEIYQQTDLRAALNFLCQLPSDFRVNKVTALDDQSLQAQTLKTSIIFDLNSDIGQVVSTLQTLLAGFRMKSDMPKQIDLRFDKPVVTY
jgi:hypothetical protein